MTMETFIQDARFAIRMLMKKPGFTAVAVLTLALGIGVNTAMFSFVDAVLLKPLGYADAERLVTISETFPQCERCLPSPPTYVEWKTQNTVFSHVSAYKQSTDSLNLTGQGDAEQIQGRFVSADYFETIGIQPAMGRAFAEGEDQIGNEQVVVLSNRFWQRRFGADAGVVGSSITLNEQPYTVIGVLPSGGVLDRMENDVWLPLTIRPDQMRRSTQFFSARARLKPGVSVEQADAEMKRLSESIAAQDASRKGFSVIVEPLRKSIVSTDLRGVMLLLMGAVLFILLIASVNVANLLLARGASRHKEIVIRTAVGAGRRRLVRQLLTESLLLAVAGGVAGVLLAFWLIEAFSAFMPASTIPQEAEVAIDLRALAFTAGISLVTGVLFGVIPAWQATKVNLRAVLQEQSAGASARLSRNKSRSLLLISEIALTFVLVVGATLLIRSFGRLLQVDPGFQSEEILTFRTTLSQSRFPQPAQAMAYQEEMLAGIRALSGVKSVSITNSLPMSGSGGGTDFLVAGRPEKRSGNARVRAIDADYFKAMGISLIKGRSFAQYDVATSPVVATINQTMAQKIWPEGDPLGQQLLFLGPQPFTIVGVVTNTKHNGLSSESPLEIYVPRAQIPAQWFNFLGRSLNFVARTSEDPKKIIAGVQSIAAGIDKDQPLYAIKTMDQVFSESIAQPRFTTLLFGIFGALALLLAATGIYGVMSYSAAQRTQEIGIRMALGATPRDALNLVMGQGLKLVIAGVIIGAGASFALTRFLSSLLFGVSATDPLTFAITPLLLAGVALGACFAPARRATKVDPIVALRYE